MTPEADATATVDTDIRATYKDNFFSGVPPRRGPSNGYITPTGQARRELHEIRSITSDMGRLGEAAVLALWSGELRPDPAAVAKFGQIHAQVNALFAPIHRQRLSRTQTGLAYIEEASKPKTKTLLGQLFEMTDVFLAGISPDGNASGLFQQRYINCHAGGEIISPNIGYLIQTALIITQEITRAKSPLPGVVHPDFKINTDKHDGLGLQLDGIIAGQGSEVHLRDNILVPTPQNTVHEPYGLLEIKVPTGHKFLPARALTTRPMVREIARIQHQLAKLVIHGLSRGATVFDFPEALYFCYLRAYYPHAIHRVVLDSHFFEAWVDILDRKISYDESRQLTIFPTDQSLAQAKSALAVLAEAGEQARTREEKKETRRVKESAALAEQLGKDLVQQEVYQAGLPI